MPRRPVLSEEQVRAEFSRIREGGLKLLSAYPTKAEYYYWRRLFTDLGLCGHQSRPDRLVRARRYCVNWRLKNREKLFSIRKEKSEALRQAKLSQITNNPHPYFWSPFILIGDAQ